MDIYVKRFISGYLLGILLIIGTIAALISSSGVINFTATKILDRYNEEDQVIEYINKDLLVNKIYFGDYLFEGEDTQLVKGSTYVEVYSDNEEITLSYINSLIDEIYLNDFQKDFFRNYPYKEIPLFTEIDGRLYRCVDTYQNVMPEGLYDSLDYDAKEKITKEDDDLSAKVKISDDRYLVYSFKKDVDMWKISSNTCPKFGVLKNNILIPKNTENT